MGDPNASIPTPQPVHYRPMFGALGGARSRHPVTFISQPAQQPRCIDQLGLEYLIGAVQGLPRGQQVRHGAERLPAEDRGRPADLQVRADGELLTCEPAEVCRWRSAIFFSDMADACRRQTTGAARHDADPAAGEAAIKSRLRVTLDDGRQAGLFCPWRNLSDGDCLLAERRQGVAVRAAAETLSEVRCADPYLSPAPVTTSATGMWRCRSNEGCCGTGTIMCWMRCCRVGSGADLQQAPFEPEPGAYGGGTRPRPPPPLTRILAQLRLMQLVSPSLPIGGFTYSQGIEWAVESGWIKAAAEVEAWLEDEFVEQYFPPDLPLLARMHSRCLCEAERSECAGPMLRHPFVPALRETAELRLEESNRGRAMSRSYW